MAQDLFKVFSINESNSKWSKCIKRNQDLYVRSNDIRSEFYRDYNRILHSNSYRRLKHKTQVFFATSNDHICTRIEHVNHVSSVSYTISKHLGLNTELTSAIAIGHDIGHTPFGHAGEEFLKSVINHVTGDKFWHEKNSLRFADYFEMLPDPEGNEKNMNLTYAVRDGLICHCGEIDETSLYPREEFIDLNKIERTNQFSPYTWEGCVVKVADKISYLGRDIEDAIALKILSISQLKELSSILKNTIKLDLHALNNTVLIHDFIVNLCMESSPDKGIKLSPSHFEFMKAVKDFNYENIYKHSRLTAYKEYANLVLKTIYSTLNNFYQFDETFIKLERNRDLYPTLITYFIDWLVKYSDIRSSKDQIINYLHKVNKLRNTIVYKLNDQKDYRRAILDFISGMTDSFAIRVFNEIMSF